MLLGVADRGANEVSKGTVKVHITREDFIDTTASDNTIFYFRGDGGGAGRTVAVAENDGASCKEERKKEEGRRGGSTFPLRFNKTFPGDSPLLSVRGCSL